MSTPSSPTLLAALIADRDVTEEEIVKTLNAPIAPSTGFMGRLEGYSPLLWAILRGSNRIIIEILKKQTPSQFLESFSIGSGGESRPGATAAMFLRLLDMDISTIPDHIRPLISELTERKMTALLTSLEGASSLFGITWTMDGHHNYKYVSDMLFRTINSNQSQIMENIKSLKEVKESKEHAEMIAKSVKEAMDLMQNLSAPGRTTSSTVMPYLVGTTGSGPEALHAEGFVMHGDYFLHVERSTPWEPGVTIYRKKSGFNETTFKALLERIQRSTQGGTENALDPDSYMGQLTETHLERIDPPEGYIRMSQQGPRDCTTASPEGIYLATLYSILIERGMPRELASTTSAACTTAVFRANKIIETEKMLERSIKRCFEAVDSNYLNELAGFLRNVEAKLTTDGLLNESISKKFAEFHKICAHRIQSLAPALIFSTSAAPSTIVEQREDTMRLVSELLDAAGRTKRAHERLKEHYDRTTTISALSSEAVFRRIALMGIPLLSREHLENTRQDFTRLISATTSASELERIQTSLDRLIQTEVRKEREINQLIASWAEEDRAILRGPPR